MICTPQPSGVKLAAIRDRGALWLDACPAPDRHVMDARPGQPQHRRTRLISEKDRPHGRPPCRAKYPHPDNLPIRRLSQRRGAGALFLPDRVDDKTTGRRFDTGGLMRTRPASRRISDFKGAASQNAPTISGARSKRATSSLICRVAAAGQPKEVLLPRHGATSQLSATSAGDRRSGRRPG